VRRVLSDAGRTVGRAVADLANSLNPELVVVGGTLGGSPSLIQGLRASIDRYAQPDTAAALEVVPGDLGIRSAVVGAVALAIARVAAG
jgi:predicted NBD/HSP70 family sugar kinase